MISATEAEEVGLPDYVTLVAITESSLIWLPTFSKKEISLSLKRLLMPPNEYLRLWEGRILDWVRKLVITDLYTLV